MQERVIQRSSGILLHPTSLPAAHGIGDLGPDAHRFVDFLVAAGQRFWQILPLGPTGYGDSPYAARSAFAGSPLLISLDQLRDQGLIDSAEVAAPPSSTPGRVDHPAVAAFKLPALQRAAEKFFRTANRERLDALAAFQREQARWLEDYALFMALHDAGGGTSWQEWEADAVRRDPRALEAARSRHDAAIDFHVFTQFVFWEQWQELRRYANGQGVRFIGDIPIFVAMDSADVWAHPEMFSLDERGYPTVVAGVPPDYFSATGQRWGNPLYRWDVMARDGYRWWVDRFGRTLETVDIIRIDHFRGFQACWEIPAEHPTAQHGRWVPAPGRAVFAAARNSLGHLPIIVEDLGVITPDVKALRYALGYPGMKVLQFAFDSGPANPFLPHHYEPDVVVYTGTHDNDTTVGWYQSRSEAERDYVRRYLATDGRDIAWDMMRLAMSSVAELAIVPLQDVLSLGTEARMNFPSRPEGNWGWRLRPGELTAKHATRLRDLTETYGRLPTA